MPRNTSDEIKRQLAQAVHHLELSLISVQFIFDLMKDRTDDYPRWLETIRHGIQTMQDLLLGFALAGWNVDRERLETYRN